MGLSSISLLTYFLFSASLCLGGNPGFRIVITSKGLDYVREVGIPILEDTLSKTKISDISGKADTPIGHVDYSLKDIKLGDLKVGKSSLNSGSSGLTLDASDISISAHGDWRYDHPNFPPIKDHGSADVKMSDSSLSLSVILGDDKNGHPTLTTSKCSIKIGHLDVTFHGGASWLYNLFADHIADSFKGTIEKELCDAAKDEINKDGNKEVESFPVVVKIDDHAQANYAFIDSPIFKSSYIETNHKGEFQSVTHPVESTLTPSALPDPTSSDKMLYVWFTDYVANTAGVVYQQAGVLEYQLTPDNVPASSPIKLNTYTFQLLIPQLYKMYPNVSMILNITAFKPPTMAINAKTVNLTVPTYVHTSVQDSSNKTTKQVFTLQMAVYCDVKVWVSANGSKEILMGNATFLEADLSLISTNIGQFDLTKLQNFANTLSQQIIIPLLNGYLNKGLEIPTFSGVSFVDSAVTLGDRYVMVSTDVHYKPPESQDYGANYMEL